MQAQNDGKIRVKGVVLDETTRQPIAFANIGIIGTAAGAASDMDGLFELIVSEKLATYMMRVSAVGYASAEMKVYEARDKGEVQILLKPVTYGIGEVDVTAESLVLKKLTGSRNLRRRSCIFMIVKDISVRTWSKRLKR